MTTVDEKKQTGDPTGMTVDPTKQTVDATGQASEATKPTVDPTERAFGATGQTLEATVWAAGQVGACELGDARLTKRLVVVAAAVAQKQDGSITACASNDAEAKAAYRMLNNPKVTAEAICKPHISRVRETLATPGEYILIEDTTSLNYSQRPALQGVGPIGDGAGRGIMMHTTLAARIEDIDASPKPVLTLVGLFDQHTWVRGEAPLNAGETRRDKLSRDRESERWGRSLKHLVTIDDATYWHTADREGDIYETLARDIELGIDFVIRASHARRLVDEEQRVLEQDLFERAADGELLGELDVELRARPGQKARTARVQVRAASVTIRPPWRPASAKSRLKPIDLRVVHVCEVNAPADVKNPLCWTLLTSAEVAELADARRVIGLYRARWLIEEYHKCVKTGCRVEDSQVRSIQPLTNVVAIKCLVAVHLLDLQLVARATPDEPVSEQRLGRWSKATLSAKFGEPPGGWTVGTALIAIARLGGYLARRSDPPPGWLVIWRGYQRLLPMSDGFALASRCG